MFRAINCFSTRNINISQEDLSSPIKKPTSSKELKSLWKNWSNNGELSENRDIAYLRVKDCIKRESRYLDLSNLGLKSLPPRLPAYVNSLHLANNQLEELPPAVLAQQNIIELNISSNQLTQMDEIPNSIIFLDISNNNLTNLPTLPEELRILYMENNQLTEIPSLPETLESINFSYNRVSNFPDFMSNNIQDVNAYDNNITDIRFSIQQFTPRTRINLRNNPLTNQSILNIASLRNSPTGSPRIVINPELIENLLHSDFLQNLIASANQLQSLPLVEVIAKWYPEKEHSKICATWKNFTNEENSQEFSNFMNRLNKSTQSNMLKPSVLLLLSKLVESAPLRTIIFAVTFDATTSCDDRLSLTWNNIQKAVTVHEAESGSYDQNLHKLIQVAKELFCLEQLELIASKKVKELVNIDEIEVYLAYQNRLAEKLNLSTAQGDMLFGNLSGVTQADLNTAEKIVKHQLKLEFKPWFYCWGPWHAVMSRIASEGFEQAKEQLYEFIDNDYSEQVQNKLSGDALNGILDAESIVGKIILKEREQKIFGALTKNVLSKHGIDFNQILLIE